jgi:putative FmdB family regulatory protein
VPTYAYACTACDHRFEVRQSFTDPALSQCPECSGGVRKLFNSVGIVFKGSGFYKTDSRAGNGNSANGSAKDGSAKDGSAKDGSAKNSAAKESSSGSGSGDKAAATAGSSGTGSSSAA